MSADAEAVAGAEFLVQSATDQSKRFFDLHGVGQAKEKDAIVAKFVAKAVAALDPIIGEFPSDAKVLAMKGKVLNLGQGYNADAETVLSKAVKLAPTNVEAWNDLAEIFWKKGDKVQAKSCFETALGVSRTKETLGSLSMLLRSLDGTEIEKSNNITDSVEMAKEALAIDIACGKSWFLLGNAYLALFFATMETTEHVTQALKAYIHAERDTSEAKNNPDLHFNRATVHEYMEEYDKAVEGYHLASVLDPGWPGPPAAIEKIKVRTNDIVELIDQQGKMKAKKLAGIVGLLKMASNPEKYTNLSNLSEGVNAVKAVRMVVTKVFPVAQPQAFLAVDATGAWVHFTVYNMAPDAIKMEDTVIIPEPFLKQVKIQMLPLAGTKGESVYPSIRVDNPVTVQVNGDALGESNLAKSSLAISSTTTAAGSDE